MPDSRPEPPTPEPPTPAPATREPATPVPAEAVGPFEVSADVLHEMVAHCLAALPDEGCGLVAGPPGGGAVRCYPTRNAAASAKVYTVDPGDHLRADIDAEAAGMQILGVFHSHTHTDAYPSPTDVGQAPDPEWHYLLVSLRHEVPAIRSYRIRDGNILEEPIVVTGRYNLTS